MKLRVLTILGLAYCGLLVYASLMPYDLDFNLSIKEALGRVRSGWPVDPDARISGSDLLSNLVLYIPLGWLIAVRLRLGSVGLVSSLLAGAFICSFLSACIEGVQTMTESRIASSADWLLNTVSGTTGSACGAVCGKGQWLKAVRWLRECWGSRPLDIATMALIGLMTADALTPFLPTILLSQVADSLKQAHFSVIEGLGEHPWHWWLITRIMTYAALSMLLAAWGKRRPGFKARLTGAAIGGALALVLEIGKLMIVSRTFNIANVAASGAGCLLGVLLGSLLADRMSKKKKLEWAIAVLMIYVFYLAWSPFSFLWDLEEARSRLPSLVQIIPLYHYAMGSDLNHARLFVQGVFFQGLLVYLLRIRFEWFEGVRSGIALAALWVAFIGFLQEAGQLFLPSRTPSPTDIYCFALGGGLGAWIRRPAAHSLESAGTPEPNENPTKEGGPGYPP
jgi:VanZ family protein